MKVFPIHAIFCGIFVMVISLFKGEASQGIDKRNLAALAKNGRLLKYANAQKKEGEKEFLPSSENEGEDTFFEGKRHVGAFLKTHGKPNFMRSANFVRDSDREGKRNIASMARLGRLNSMRFARMQQPYSVGGKRMNSEEASNNDEDNSINVFDDPECLEIVESEVTERPVWVQKKRYVAALARSGRLPIWHSQRIWWGGKRDYSRPSYISYSGGVVGNREENTIDDDSYVALKRKRCKRIYSYEPGKRNIAALAKNGKLPFRPNI